MESGNPATPLHTTRKVPDKTSCNFPNAQSVVVANAFRPKYACQTLEDRSERTDITVTESQVLVTENSVRSQLFIALPYRESIEAKHSNLFLCTLAAPLGLVITQFSEVGGRAVSTRDCQSGSTIAGITSKPLPYSGQVRSNYGTCRVIYSTKQYRNLVNFACSISMGRLFLDRSKRIGLSLSSTSERRQVSVVDGGRYSIHPISP